MYSKLLGTLRLTRLNIKLTYKYEQLPAETYFINQRDTNAVRHATSVALKPLKGSNQGGVNCGDEVYLTGVPYGATKETYKDYDTFNKICIRKRPDLIFLQIDPSPYIARQRFLAHKCALQGLEDYQVQDCHQIDPLKPHAWEEAVVSLTVLDMLLKNKNFDDINWNEGLATYSYPTFQDKQIRQRNTNVFIDCIDEHIVNHKYSQYQLINRILYTALMGKHKVLLGDMPEHLNKMNIGNTLEIGEARDIFKFMLKQVKQLTVPISLRKATHDFLPHIFQAPRDLYMTAMLKEAFQGAEDINAYVGVPHMDPISHYWVGSPYGINYSEATRIPPRRVGETDEHMIEKQALLDVLLETHTWAEPYLSNPFPYLVEDITKVSEKDHQAMKECFFNYYQKYSAFKHELQKELPNFKDDEEIRFIEQQPIPNQHYQQPIEIKAYKQRQLDQIKKIQISQ